MEDAIADHIQKPLVDWHPNYPSHLNNMQHVSEDQSCINFTGHRLGKQFHWKSCNKHFQKEGPAKAVLYRFPVKMYQDD